MVEATVSVRSQQRLGRRRTDIRWCWMVRCWSLAFDKTLRVFLLEPHVTTQKSRTMAKETGDSSRMVWTNDRSSSCHWACPPLRFLVHRREERRQRKENNASPVAPSAARPGSRGRCCLPTEVEGPELDYPSRVPLTVTGPSFFRSRRRPLGIPLCWCGMPFVTKTKGVQEHDKPP